ncbi:S8 family serine peptidase [Metabacillus sp. RGM 3146]|uniref:S8 family serine peptidase n=1 Tax=Metabacillus sp. RGM 3146 TaxID=3401092 RepID=UPI003B999EEE
MRRTFFILLSCFFLFQPSAAAVKFPEHPPLPKEKLSDIMKMVIVVRDQEWGSFLKKAGKNPDIKIKHTYTNVFKGISIEGKRRSAEKLLNDPAVIQSGPVTIYQTEIDKSVPFIGGDEARRFYDKNHNRLTGKGVKVGIIDTGIDYGHPDLKGNFKGGYDLVDGDEDPMETKGEDSTATLHGTHVAGIIAANGKLKGVAPEADIIAYRALGPGGSGTSEQVIAAIDKAIEDKVDILNLSLGNSINGPDWPTSLALDKAAEKGIVTVTASGNSGPEPWTVGSPGTSGKSIAVGASSPPMKIYFLHVKGLERKVQLDSMECSAGWKALQNQDLVLAGKGKPSEFSPQAKGRIALVERGGIPFSKKAANAKKAGASGLIIYNNEKGQFSGSLEKEIGIPVAAISRDEGKWLKKQIKKLLPIKIISQEGRDKMADFSSRGPVTVNWQIKPDLVAPGMAINSTVPDGYLSLQGTSMAAPHVAGAAALIKQAHPEWSPMQVKASLMTTAKPLYKERNSLYEPIEQGAGRIDIPAAINAEELIIPGSMTFSSYSSKAPRTVKKTLLTIENLSKKTKSVTFSYPKKQKGVTWQFPHKLKIAPHQAREASVSLELYPYKMKEGIHQGWVSIYIEGKERKIPYLFVINEPDYPRVMGFDFKRGPERNSLQYEMYLPGGADEAGIALYDPVTYTFKGYLDWAKHLQRGIFKKVIHKKELQIQEGSYKALIFAKKGKQENVMEVELEVRF